MGVVQLDLCAFLQGKNIFSASLCQLHAIWGGCSAEACVLCLLALLSLLLLCDVGFCLSGHYVLLLTGVSLVVCSKVKVESLI
jgi:hypothetical protein